jgi:hypothetical protein
MLELLEWYVLAVGFRLRGSLEKEKWEKAELLGTGFRRVLSPPSLSVWSIGSGLGPFGRFDGRGLSGGLSSASSSFLLAFGVLMISSEELDD